MFDMRQSLVIPMCILLAGCGGGGKASRTDQIFPPAPVYPMTRQVTAKDTIHGVEVADPYRWLEDEKSPEVQTWMKAQDGLTRSYLSGLPGRAAIADRLRQLMYVDEILPPTYRGTRYFYGRRHANKEKRVYYWREGNDGEERVLFDPNTWSADGSLSLGTFSISENGTTVAYTVRQNNADEAILYVMDVATGRKSTVDVIDGAKYASPSWTPDGKGFYISQGYTRPERLAIQGGSNGGLLVGAALTQNPGLYRVVICTVPLIDMIRYHLFGSGKTWISEYGSAEDAGQFRSLLAYSPYHHVQPATRYPTVLLLSADSDDRVDPMHARKFAAALQAASTNGPVLLRIESHAGHGGADMIKAAIEEDADSLAFIFAQMGIRP
jgi:prolyl oligopeptidase PreP (S9A serine peptidase family)